jgi:hypothetical protein
VPLHLILVNNSCFFLHSFFIFFINLLLHEHIAKNGRFHSKASCNNYNLLWNYVKCFNTDVTWHKCWLDHSLCNSMLNRKFPVTTATGDVFRLPKITILHCFFSIKTDFKVFNFSMNLDRVKGFLANRDHF